MIMQPLFTSDFRLDRVLRKLLTTFFQRLRVEFFNWLRFDTRHLG